jgi:hypothetical protein
MPSERAPKQLYFTNRQEDVIQDDQEEDGLMFEDGTA